jgi:hypothetical protein
MHLQTNAYAERVEIYVDFTHLGMWEQNKEHRTEFTTTDPTARNEWFLKSTLS